MRKKRTIPRTTLTTAQSKVLFQAIWEALDPNGAPLRLAELVEVARKHDADLGATWDFYLLVSDELQRMKRDNCCYLVKGKGGGWVRADRPVGGA